MLYYEWCQRPNLRKGLMVTEQGLDVLSRDRDSGYRSVYMFDEGDAKEIEAAHHSRGLDKYIVHSDCIFIDIDTGSSSLDFCLKELRSHGLAHRVYNSGNKGFHVVIPLKETVSGINVPYSQKKWVESLGVSFDPSIYRAGALISLPGRIHPVTGIAKSLVRVEDGEELVLPLLSPPTIEFNLDSSNDSIGLGLTQLLQLVTNPPTEGERHLSIWKTAKSLAEAGISDAAALELITAINQTWDTPKEELALQQAVEGAYRG